MTKSEKKSWSDKKKWAMYLAASLVTFALSVGISYFMANLTAENTAQATTEQLITRESEQGQLVLNGIGYRYFSSVAQVIDTSTGMFIKDANDSYKNAYFLMLREVQEDFRWIQRNPVVFQNGTIMIDISQIQLFIALELSHRDDLILGNTLEIMCRLFSESDSWKAPLDQFENQTAIALIKHNATELCK